MELPQVPTRIIYHWFERGLITEKSFKLYLLNKGDLVWNYYM